MKSGARCGICLMLLALFLTVPAFAADTQRYMPDGIGCSVAVPDGLVVFTQEVDPQDPNLAEFGWDAQQLSDHYRENHIYLHAVEPDIAYEITLSAVPDEENPPDLNLYTEEERYQFIRQNLSTYDQQGITVSDYEYCEHAAERYLKMRFSWTTAAGTPQYCMEYVTVADGNNIAFTLFSYTDGVSAEQEAVLTDIVDSAALEHAEPQPVFSDAPAAYENGAAGVSFTVPAGWAYSAGKDDGEGVRYVDPEGNTISFDWVDYWASFSEEEKDTWPRASVGNGFFTAAEIQDALAEEDGALPDVACETVSGVEYYRVRAESGDGDDSTVYLLVHDGNVYYFSVDAGEDTQAHADFMELMSSVRYENLSAASSAGNLLRDALGVPLNTTAGWTAIYLLIDMGYTIVFYTAPILIYRFAVRKEPLPRKKARKIVIIYGIAAMAAAVAVGFLLGVAAPGGAVFLWGYVNYRILIGGKPKHLPGVPGAPGNPAGAAGPAGAPCAGPGPAAPPAQSFCTACGAELVPGGRFCDQCGARVEQKEEEPV